MDENGWQMFGSKSPSALRQDVVFVRLLLQLFALPFRHAWSTTEYELHFFTKRLDGSQTSCFNKPTKAAKRTIDLLFYQVSIRNLLNVFKHISAQDGVDPFINAEEIFSEASQRIQPHAPRARLDFDVLAISILVYTSHRFLMSCVKFFVDPLNNFPVMLFSLKRLLSRAAFFWVTQQKRKTPQQPFGFFRGHGVRIPIKRFNG